MKILCLGDSLTEGDYGVAGKRGIANIHKENYPYFLKKLAGADVYNFGKCGFNATTYLNFIKNGGVSEKDADIVIIMLGTNGGMSVNPKSEGYYHYIEIINLIKKDNPRAKIVLCKPPHATTNPAYSNCGHLPQITAAADAVEIAAKEVGLPIIDVFNCPEICEENVDKYQSYDGLHFVEVGYQILAEFIYGELKRLFPDLF